MKPIKAMWNTGAAGITIGATAHLLNSTAGTKNVAIAGKTGSHLAAVCISNITLPQPPTDDKGGTWVQAATMATDGGTDRVLRIYLRSSGRLVDDSTVTVTFNVTAGNTGGGMVLLRIDNADETSGYAYLDNNGDVSDGVTGVPYIAFASGACLPTNCQIGCVVSVNVAPAAPAGWTTVVASTYASPTTYYTVAYRERGETGTNISFGAASATDWCSACIELKPLGV